MKTLLVDREKIREEEAKLKRRLHLPDFWWVAVPILLSVWYSCAAVFPPGARAKAPWLLWTDGVLVRVDGVPEICPRESICSQGVFQILLICLARLSAFASYPVMALTFMSKMHSTIHFLSDTYAGNVIPFAALHWLHRSLGLAYFLLAWLHTITHLIRYSVRYQIAEQLGSRVGVSGIFAIFAMTLLVWGMTLAKKGHWSFEQRFNFHWMFLLLLGALLFHPTRTLIITCIFGGAWALDYLYGYIYRTHKLDVVEFMPVPCTDGTQAGTQMLWRNPAGFKPRSGEYVRVKLPWLTTGGNEWHPFSLYLREATREGVQCLEKQENGRIRLGDESGGTREVDSSTTALLLVEFQNEFCTRGGKLYADVATVMRSNNMLNNTAALADLARRSGSQVIHVPFIYSDRASSNTFMGIIGSMRNKTMFIEDSWGADYIKSHKPHPGDVEIKGKDGIDCFAGTNLEDVILDKGIETLIVGGFLTNACVESTIRVACEKGINVISLTDGTACASLEEQQLATEKVHAMFSTPMTCEDAAQILRGDHPPGSESARQQATITRSTSFKQNPWITRTTSFKQNPLDSVDLEDFIEDILDQPVLGGDEEANQVRYIQEAARKDLTKQYETTQIFVAPAGDWSSGLSTDIKANNHGRTCWVTGPFTSPYTIAGNFSHHVLMASGIGITPSLGVMGQFPDSSRTKILVWSVRSRGMLKFFAPLLGDAHLVCVFYTGKEKLTSSEVRNICKYGNIFLEQARPKSLTGTIETIIATFEQELHGTKGWGGKAQIKDVTRARRAAWCILYCGGSVKIKDMLQDFAKKTGTGWDSELFDW